VSEQALRVLVVEDDPLLSDALVAQLIDWGFSPGTACCVSEGLAALEQEWVLVLLDLALPDGSGVEIAEASFVRAQRPLIVALTGSANVEEAFRLAQLGVCAYLRKPVDPHDLRETVRVVLETASSSESSLESLVKEVVGSTSYHEITDRVRRAMLEQALQLAGGSKAGAARILKVSRQAIQQLVRAMEL